MRAMRMPMGVGAARMRVRALGTVIVGVTPIRGATRMIMSAGVMRMACAHPQSMPPMFRLANERLTNVANPGNALPSGPEVPPELEKGLITGIGSLLPLLALLLWITNDRSRLMAVRLARKT